MPGLSLVVASAEAEPLIRGAEGRIGGGVARFLDCLTYVVGLDSFMIIFSGEYAVRPGSRRVREVTRAIKCLVAEANRAEAAAREKLPVEDVRSIVHNLVKVLYIVTGISDASRQADALADSALTRSYLALRRIAVALGLP